MKIAAIKTIVVNAQMRNWVFVKVETAQPGLHGWGEEAIVRAVNNGFTNQMPAQSAVLNEGQINVLAAYVLSLSSKPATKQ